MDRAAFDYEQVHSVLGVGHIVSIFTGELLAFQLALFMQIRTVPAIAVGKITTNENSTWAGQGSRLEALALMDDMYVTLIQWMPSLTE